MADTAGAEVGNLEDGGGSAGSSSKSEDGEGLHFEGWLVGFVGGRVVVGLAGLID